MCVFDAPRHLQQFKLADSDDAREARVKVLILKERKRTLKALQAIVRGIWMVDESWLHRVRENAP